jgi:hypothetical protein
MRAPRWTGVVVLLAPWLLVGAAAGAEPDTYGTALESYVNVPGVAFLPLNPSDGPAYTTGDYGMGGFVSRYGPGNSFLAAPVILPSGAQITSIYFNYCDLNAASNRSYLRLAVTNFEGYVVNTSQFIYSAYGGCSSAYADVTPAAITVDNYRNAYHLVFYNNIGDGSESISGVVVGYRLQVSPPPATAHFNDVPTDHPFFQFIEALYSAGITGGCGGGNFCPNSPVTRGQMAVFLAKALGLAYQ